MAVAIAAIIGFGYAKFITNAEDGSAGKQAFRSGILVAMTLAIVHYLTDGRKDAMLAEPFYGN
jgi:hypothetical protein